MKWLLTVQRGTSSGRLHEMLGPSGSRVSEHSAPISMDDSEVVIEVDGPENLPEQIKNAPEIREVYPSSELTLY